MDIIFCAVDGCPSSEKDMDILRKFYRFPLDAVRCRQWIRAANRNDLLDKDISVLHQSYRICNLHFTASDYFYRSLKTNAVPTLNLSQCPQLDMTVKSKFMQTNTKTDTQTNTQTDTQTNTQTETQMITKTDTQTNTQIDTQTNTQTDTQTNTQTDTQTNTQTDTQTNTQTDTQMITQTDTQMITKTDTQTNAQTEMLTKPQLNNQMNMQMNTQAVLKFGSSHTCLCGSYINIYDPKNTGIYEYLPIKSVTKTSEFSTQTPQRLIDDLPIIKQLKKDWTLKNKEVKLLEKQLKFQRKKAEDIETTLSPVVKRLINHRKRCKINSKGNRYDFEYKMFALNVYSASPLAYRILAKTLNLPSPKALRRSNTAIGTSLSETVSKCLQNKVNKLIDSDKICVLCADETPLKRHLYKMHTEKVVGYHEVNGVQKPVHASRAFVLMLRGLLSKWKQPVAYCFLSDNLDLQELNNWLDGIIIKILDIGFNVVAFTSGLGSNFISLAESRNVTSANPFFYINNRKMYYMFDVPQLLNALKRNLINNDFIWHANGKKEIARWTDILKLHSINMKSDNKMQLKLKEPHLKPINAENKIKYSTQVFSKSVATAIQNCVTAGELPNEALGTAKLVELINDTFDVLNSSPLCVGTYIYKTPFYQKEYQMVTLQDMLWFLNNVCLVQNKTGKNIKNCEKSLQSFATTIESVIRLSTDLRNQNFQYIYTRRLHRDIFDNFFRILKQQGIKPTPHKFAQGFRILFLTVSNH